MKARTKISIVATGGLAAALLATTLDAQVPAPVPGQVPAGGVAPGQVPPGDVIPGQVPAGDMRQERVMTGAPDVGAGQGAQMMIGHGLAMAIDGTVLKDSAERYQQKGEQNAQRMNSALQLMTHARHEMQEGQRMINDAGRDPWAPQPLRNAASGYVNTLFSLCGGPAQGGNAANLNDSDKATVCLINHAICEAIDASMLLQSTRMLGATSAVGEQLQRHAQQMMAGSRETLQRLLGRGNAERGNRAGNAADRQGEASVMSLAQRGREVIDALQTGAAQPAGAVGVPGFAPGTIRENTLPGAPGGAIQEGTVPAAPGGTIRERTSPATPGGGRDHQPGGTTVPGGSTSSESRGNTIPGGAGSGTNRGGVPGGIPGEKGSNNPPR